MKYTLIFLFVFACFCNSFAQDYKEIINRSVKQDGIITTYKDKEDYYFEFNNRFKNKYFILYSTNLTSIDNLGIFAGFPMSQMVIRFQEVKGAINLVQIGTQILPDTSKFSNYNQEVTSRFGPLKIDYKQNESDSANKLTKINQFFEGDIPNLAYEFQQMFGGGYYMINPDMTYIENVKSFPNNIEIFVNYVFTSQAAPNPNVPDARSINFRIRYSLIAIPENKNYIPRYNDDRVGYFTSDFKDYSKPNRPTEYTSYINRWDLRKKDPYAELSEPVKPIVYYIDRATPTEYREPIRKGVLLWNKAFEKIGFKNAVECRIQEDTAKWDVEDIRYNVIRWQSSSSSGLAGVGPSLANPFTGEIINASVLLNSEIVSYLRSERELISSLALTKPETYFYQNIEQKFFKHNKCSDKFCNYSNYSKLYVANALTAIRVNNNISDENSDLIQQFIDNYLTDLVVHEVGHTLGLRHNFKASSAYTFAQIRDSNYTKDNAIGSSVMDYNPVNLSPPGHMQGQYWSGTVGNYDLFAIEYGYKIFPDIKNPNDEIPFLLAVASKSQDPLNVYGTDEDVYDAFGPTSLDPLTQQFDLGNSPLEYAKEKIVITEDLLKKIQNYYPQYDRSFMQLSRVFRGLLFDYLSSVGYAAKYVGGAYVTRMKSGDFMGTKYPYEPVSAQEQMQALELVNEYIFHVDRHLNFSPDFLQLLQPNTAAVWEGQSRLDVPVNEIILNYQNFYLQRFYNSILTGRMLQQEKVSSNSLPLAAMFDYIKTNVWSELKNQESFSATRKNLQKAHLDILIVLVVNPYYGTPEEARSLAYYDLNNLKREIASKRANNIYDEFHLKECASRIDKALNSVFIDQNN